MAINLENIDSEVGVWVEYDEDVSFKLRHLSPKKVSDIRKKFISKKIVGGVRQEEIKDKDQKKFDLALYDHIIEDWEGIKLHGSNAECNRENKTKLMNGSIDISVFILDEAKKIHEEKIEVDENEEKNLQTSSDLN